MKRSHVLWLTSLLMAGNIARADEMDRALQCLSYGRAVMKDNPEMLRVLRQARISTTDIQEDNYSGNIGTQYIATELVAGIRNETRPLGYILCLFESDAKPLYFRIIPAPQSVRKHIPL